MKKKINIGKLLVIVLFVLVLLLPTLNKLLNVLPDIASGENRTLKEKPELNIQLLDPYPKAFEEYYNDNYVFRNRLHKQYANFNINIVKKSPTEKCIIGKEGWFFMYDREKNYYPGMNKFSEKELKAITQEIVKQRDYVESKSCVYYFVILPIKSSIYLEHVPDKYYQKGEPTQIDLLVDYIKDNTNIKVVDVRRGLIHYKDMGRLYHKTDNHWNDLGAYYGYYELMKEIKEDLKLKMPLFEKEDLIIKERQQPGQSIVRLMGVKEQFKEDFIYAFTKNGNYSEGEDRNYPIPENFFNPESYTDVYTSESPDSIKALVIRDSFAENMKPFLCPHFKETVFIFDSWKHRLNQEIFDKEKPDIFIQLTLESMINNMIDK